MITFFCLSFEDYYQWVSLVLALQAIMCYLPRLVWEAITFNRIGTNLGFLVEAAQAASKETGAARTKRVQFLATSIDTLLFARRPIKQQPQNPSKMNQARAFVGELFPKKRLGRALCAYYMITKLGYLMNSVGQILLMEYFLGMEGRYRLFGLQILTDLFQGRHWKETLIFPRVGFCRVPIKLVSPSVPTLVAQCTLPVNMLNEKIYIFLWFWFVFVSTLECISVSVWVLRLSARKRRVSSLIHYLKVADVYNDAMRDTLDQFELTFLRPDGTFLLHMLRLNAGEIITHEILQALVERYVQHEKASLAKNAEGSIIPNSLKNQSINEPLDGCALKQRFI